MRNKIVLDPSLSPYAQHDPGSKSFLKRVGRLAESLQILPLDFRAVDSGIPQSLKVYPHLLLSYERVLRPTGAFRELFIFGPEEAEVCYSGNWGYAALWAGHNFRIWLPKSVSGVYARHIISLQVPTSRRKKSGEPVARYTECALDFDGKVNIY